MCNGSTSWAQAHFDWETHARSVIWFIPWQSQKWLIVEDPVKPIATSVKRTLPNAWVSQKTPNVLKFSCRENHTHQSVCQQNVCTTGHQRTVTWHVAHLILCLVQSRRTQNSVLQLFKKVSIQHLRSIGIWKNWFCMSATTMEGTGFTEGSKSVDFGGKPCAPFHTRTRLPQSHIYLASTQKPTTAFVPTIWALSSQSSWAQVPV
jgi:hypothetical protein